MSDGLVLIATWKPKYAIVLSAKEMPHLLLLSKSFGSRLSSLEKESIIDHTGSVGDYWSLRVTDTKTKWLELIPVPNTASDLTITALCNLFTRFGLPQCLPPVTMKLDFVVLNAFSIYN